MQTYLTATNCECKVKWTSLTQGSAAKNLRFSLQCILNAWCLEGLFWKAILEQSKIHQQWKCFHISLSVFPVCAKDDLPEHSEIFFLLSPTLEALVDSRGEGVSQHHHSGVNDDFPASALWSCNLPLASATVQFQYHLIVMPIKDDLVPFAVVEAIGGQG